MSLINNLIKRFGWRKPYEPRGSRTVLRGAEVKLLGLLTLMISDSDEGSFTPENGIYTASGNASSFSSIKGSNSMTSQSPAFSSPSPSYRLGNSKNSLTFTLTTGEFVRYYVWDHLGSTRLSIRRYDAAVIEESKYLPFGKQMNQSFSPDENHKFAGYFRDLESNIDYLGFRHYNNSLYRFLQTDRIPGDVKNPLTWNPYIYAKNNVLNLIDIDGLLPKETDDLLKKLKDDLEILSKVELSWNAAKMFTSCMFTGVVPEEGALKSAKLTLEKAPDAGLKIFKPIYSEINGMNMANSLKTMEGIRGPKFQLLSDSELVRHWVNYYGREFVQTMEIWSAKFAPAIKFIDKATPWLFAAETSYCVYKSSSMANMDYMPKDFLKTYKLIDDLSSQRK